jgi:hypothetical protein
MPIAARRGAQSSRGDGHRCVVSSAHHAMAIE